MMPAARRNRPLVVLTGTVAAAVMLVLVAALPAALAQAGDPFEAMSVQRPAKPVAAPEFVFRTGDGREARLAELRGKVILLGFFSTT